MLYYEGNVIQTCVQDKKYGSADITRLIKLAIFPILINETYDFSIPNQQNSRFFYA